MPTITNELPLSEAAMRLGMSWERAWRFLLRGKLDGRKNESGRWVVSEPSIDRLRSELAEATKPRAA